MKRLGRWSLTGISHESFCRHPGVAPPRQPSSWSPCFVGEIAALAL